MGVNGCGWVQMGALGRRGHGNTETRQRGGGIYGLIDQDLGCMIEEISSDMMFCGCCQKWSKMYADGCRWITMGAMGLVGTREPETTQKFIKMCV